MKSIMPFKMHKIIFFPENKLKNMCAYPTKNFQTGSPKHSYFYLVLPGKASRMLVESQGLPSDSACVLGVEINKYKEEIYTKEINDNLM